MQEVTVQSLQESIAQLQAAGGHMWMMVAAALVLLMQAGFLLIEAGMVRTKNSINVAQKNISDFMVSIGVFYLIGFGLMFGSSWGGVLGTDGFAFFGQDSRHNLFFVLQAAFAGTAATIMSGAVAERMRYSAYLFSALFVVAVIYPVSGHWVWGGLLNGGNPAFLADRGFIDFAGSTVVHSVGGWVALAAVIVLGARRGKFTAGGMPNEIQGHSYVLATAGALLLWVGWIGFNSATVPPGAAAFSQIILKTLLAGAFGGLGGLLMGRALDDVNIPRRPINGSLGGLVAVSAGCEVVTLYGALLTGLAAGVCVVISESVIERRFKLDDVAGAVSVHGVCGALGTVLLAFLALPGSFAAPTAWAQALVQLEGVAVIFAWAFGGSFLFFKLLDRAIGIRVPLRDEVLGLNAAEHGATLGTGTLQAQLQAMTANGGGLSGRLDESTGDEAAELAALFNPFIAEMHEMMEGIRAHAWQMQRSSAGLQQLSDQFADRAAETSALSQEMAETLDGAAGTAGDCSGLATQILGEVYRLNSGAEGMAAGVAAASGAISGLGAALQESTGNAQGLSEAARDAEHAASLVKGIASQTGKLAVAAIAATGQAGAGGQGLALLATQMQALAEHTETAAAGIADRARRLRERADSGPPVTTQIAGLLQAVQDAVEDLAATVGQPPEPMPGPAGMAAAGTGSGSQSGRPQHGAGLSQRLQNSAEASARDADALAQEALNLQALSHALSSAVGRYAPDAGREADLDSDWQDKAARAAGEDGAGPGRPAPGPRRAG